MIRQQVWCGRGVEFRSLLRFAVAAVLIWGALPTVSIHAETNIFPWGEVRQRYDSNVWFRPKELSNDQQLDDFVTAVRGGLDLRHDSRDMEADLKVAGSYNAMVHNSDLNYYAALVEGTVGLDRWIDRYARGARLSVTENLLYSPEQTLGRRIQDEGALITFRRSRIQSDTSVTGSYPLSRDVALEGGYTFGLLRQSKRAEGGEVAGATFFDVMSHTWFGGPRYNLTRNDSVAALYRQTFFTQERSGGGRTFSTNIITLEGDYTKEFPEWQFAVRGGVTFVEPVGRSFPSGSLRVRTKPERDTVLTLTLAREALPSYFIQGGARINNRALVNIRHRVYERLSISVSGGFTLSQFFPNTDAKSQVLSGGSRLEYKLTRNINGQIFYIFSHIDVERTALEYQVSRHQVGFMLSVFFDALGESLGFD